MQVDDGRVARVDVKRAAPCGASWEAAQKVLGLDPKQAAIRYGLETQIFCKADPSAWDPLWGQSPVHFAAKVHAAAFEKGLK